MALRDDVRERMGALFEHEPYEFQLSAVTELLEGRSVVLRAPTGAGKTDVALAPTLVARQLGTAFPRQMIYAVPMRVLATQFLDKTRRLIRIAARNGVWPGSAPAMKIQTGERPEDPRFESDLVFTTIDQTLASYLNIPYGLPSRLGNLNAGALVAAHFVADEFHLFDPDAALPTTVDMLRMFRSAAPFLLMTATCSDAILRLLTEQLHAVAIQPSEDELAAMASQRKRRTYELAGEPLTAGAVLKGHVKRSIVVCNTVEGAQDLYEALCAAEQRTHLPAGTEIRLLHSRFLHRDRRRIEAWCRRTFRHRPEQKVGTSAILIATQVVEVGLDITCDVLHTELAPANSIVQRAGRCARYSGESGRVIVYDLPVRDNGEPNYAPYLDEPLLSAIKATPAALAALCGGDASFGDELHFVETAHGPSDQVVRDRISAQAPAWRADVIDTIQNGDRRRTEQLIRESDSRTLLVLSDPDACSDPYSREGFSFQTGTLQGRVRAMLEQSAAGGSWTVKAPTEQMPEGPEYGAVAYRWQSLANASEVRAHPVIAANPSLVHYDNRIGFRFRPGTPCESPLLDPATAARPPTRYSLTRYSVHIRGLFESYRQDADRLTIATSLVARAVRTDAETLRTLACACLALHDAGKLAAGWVNWATAWEQLVDRLGNDEPLPWLVSHTDYDGARDWQRTTEVRPRRPSHAAEGSIIVHKVVERLAGGQQRLWQPTLAAIARHHSPTIKDIGAFRLDARASETLAEAMRVVGLSPMPPGDLLPAEEAIKNMAPAPNWGSPEQVLLYFFLVRILRGADQASFDELRRLGMRPDGSLA